MFLQSFFGHSLIRTSLTCIMHICTHVISSSIVNFVQAKRNQMNTGEIAIGMSISFQSSWWPMVNWLKFSFIPMSRGISSLRIFRDLMSQAVKRFIKFLPRRLMHWLVLWWECLKKGDWRISWNFCKIGKMKIRTPIKVFYVQSLFLPAPPKAVIGVWLHYVMLCYVMVLISCDRFYKVLIWTQPLCRPCTINSVLR